MRWTCQYRNINANLLLSIGAKYVSFNKKFAFFSNYPGWNSFWMKMSKFDWKVCDRTGIIHKVLICSEIEFWGGFNTKEWNMEYTQYRFGLSG